MIRIIITLFLPLSLIFATDFSSNREDHFNTKMIEIAMLRRDEKTNIVRIRTELKALAGSPKRSCFFFETTPNSADCKKRGELKRQLRRSKNRLAQYEAQLKHFQAELTRIAQAQDHEWIQKLELENKKLTRAVQDMGIALRANLAQMNERLSGAQPEFYNERLGELSSRMDDLKAVIDYNLLDDGHTFLRNEPACLELFRTINNTLSISMDGYFVLASNKIAFATDKTSQAAHLAGTAVGFIPGAGALGSVAECGIVFGKGHLRKLRTTRAAAFFGNSQDMHVIIKKSALKIARSYCSETTIDSLASARKLGTTIAKILQHSITAGELQGSIQAEQTAKVEALFALWLTKKSSLKLPK